jgi:geranylgeranyl diphosphate synthase, type II
MAATLNTNAQGNVRLRTRPPIKSIPGTKAERDRLLILARSWVQARTLVPPLSLSELRAQADQAVAREKTDPAYRDYLAILINNEVWREPLAAVPFTRRLLLLPKCLRCEAYCTATVDELGLICNQCGLCSIHELQTEAQRLGYAVLVAEGSALVTQLIRTGKIDAIVGVSCTSVLERAFPYMEAAAIPGIAIPLLQNDCVNTTVDLDWVQEVLYLTTGDQTRRLDLSALREEVEGWFEVGSLQEILGPTESVTEEIARSWLAQAGKRWRPFLTVATFAAMCKASEIGMPSELRKIALAIECFHKASLVHDDIEDGDLVRYGEQTLHARYGVPMALNVGDFLIGEGYRLIASSTFPADKRAEMLVVAADGQRKLCLGQGAELAWVRDPKPLNTQQVLTIFRQKTAPAFEVALLLGAICAGDHQTSVPILHQFSEALGVAYQIRDDLDDFSAGWEASELPVARPNIIAAAAWDMLTDERQAGFERLWRRIVTEGTGLDQLREYYHELQAQEKAARLLETYQEEAVASLSQMENPSLKALLRRVIGKIFHNLEFFGWCHEFETRHAAKRPVGATVAE